MMAISQPGDIQDTAPTVESGEAPNIREQEPDGLHPQRDSDLEPHHTVNDGPEDSSIPIQPTQQERSVLVETVSETTTASNIITPHPASSPQPVSQGIEEAKEDEITSAIKRLQEQMNRQAGAIEDLMMSQYSQDQDVLCSFASGAQSGSHYEPHTGTKQSRNVTERYHHHADRSTPRFEPLLLDVSISNDSASDSKDSYSSSDSDNMSMPSLSNIRPIMQSTSTPDNPSPTGPSIQAFNKSLKKLKMVHKKLKR